MQQYYNIKVNVLKSKFLETGISSALVIVRSQYDVAVLYL